MRNNLHLTHKYLVYVPGFPDLTEKYYSEEYANTVAEEIRESKDLIVWVEPIPIEEAEFAEGLYEDWSL